ncbi:MAG TPA: urea amidolyase [Paracoccaceae bacterium]|nr:urea amidolyase [Paracoccaceae bacterium]HMO71237.1 urea amidolyase [Paracoccaceae bacterium]
MTRAVLLHRAAPGVTVQDAGRPGWLGQGLSRGGAVDALSLAEGAALLGQDAGLAALEVAGSPLVMEVTAPARMALTGAPMRARAGDRMLAWNGVHAVGTGEMLDLSGSAGGFSYVHFGGGIDTPLILHSRSAHLAAGIGRMLRAGDRLPLGPDQGGREGLVLDPLPRFTGGILRVVSGPQTALFDACERARFCDTAFRKDPRGNRMGQRLIHDGPGFAAAAGLAVLSQTVVPGDVQVPGDGAPVVLLSECQTTGGYPRLGTVLPCDLPLLVQAPPGAVLRFRFVSPDKALAAERAEARRRKGLAAQLRPLVRNPRDMPDLLRYRLVDGATRGDDLDGGTA